MPGDFCHNATHTMLNQEVITEAETAAIQIPAGNAVLLPEGSRIYVTQMLGNSITAATDVGFNLFFLFWCSYFIIYSNICSSLLLSFYSFSSSIIS